MPFYKREFTGFRFEIRLARLGPADLVTERCIVCEFRRVVSPWEMLAKSSPAVALVSVLGRPMSRLRLSLASVGRCDGGLGRTVRAARRGVRQKERPLKGAQVSVAKRNGFSLTAGRSHDHPCLVQIVPCALNEERRPEGPPSVPLRTRSERP